MPTQSRVPISHDVAEVVGDYAENVDNRSLLLDKFVLHKSWPHVFLGTMRQSMKMDDASRWSFIRIAQNGESFLRREMAERVRKLRRAKDDGKRDKTEEHQICVDILQGLSKCACRKLPGNLAAQKLEQNLGFARAIAERPGQKAVVYGELQGRLIVNLSDSLIQNAGICLDRNTGLPYIPGSAVKGVARHASLAHLRNKEWTIGEFVRVFGSSEVDFRENGELHAFAADVPENERTLKGGVDFLSAQPITEPTIVVDISNVHYPEYYQSGDIRDLAKENPRPNTFPAVEKGVRYAFCIAANGMDGISAELFAKVRALLVEAITVHGIGAKTGAGYGWFTDVTAEVEAGFKWEEECEAVKRREEEEKANEEKRKAIAKAEAERIASMSSCERILYEWGRVGKVKAIVNGRHIAKFTSLGEDDKRGVVEALRSPSGIGADVWAVIKGTANDKKLLKLEGRKSEGHIRAYNNNVLKLGKMP